MKDFRVLITEKCNAKCPTCFNRNIRAGYEMDIEDFKNLCKYLANEGEIKKLKIMGGEPTVHPDFVKIIECAQKNFHSVHIFTNAINDELLKITPRAQDSIIYNVSCLDEDFDISKLLIDKPGGRLFETQLSSDCNLDKTKRVLFKMKKYLPNEKIAIALTLNCVENIFKNKYKIISIWNEISNFIHQELNIDYNIDHNIPYCFFVGSNMDIKLRRSICKIECAGLINSRLQLQYCNQSQDVLCDLKEKGSFIPFQIVENRLQEYYFKKMSKNLSKICRNCIFFSRKCNGGCFMHKDFIDIESIKSFSDLPFMNTEL